MNQYLLEILKEMSTIIIPGFGALTITNPKTGEILFMPYLKYDDGKLAKHISEKEGISENDAKNLIAKFVREIETKLNVGDSYDMYEFGTFSKKPDGEIEFVSWNSKSDPISTTLEKEPDKEKKAEKKVEKNDIPVKPKVGRPKKIIQDNTTIEDKKIVEISAESIPNPIISSTISEPIQEIESSNLKNEGVIILEETSVDEYVPENPIETEQQKPEIYSEEKQWADDLDVPPVNAKMKRPKKPILEKTKKDKKPKKRKPAFFILLTLGILLIGGTVSITVFYDKLGTVFPFMSKESTGTVEKSITEQKVEEENSTENTENSDSTELQDSLTEQLSKEESKTSQAATVTSNSEMIQTSTGLVDPSKPFHIIGGAFTERSNADRYLDKLISAGNSSVIIGRFDNLFIVSISSYSSMEEAQNSLVASKSISSNAWIFKWP